MAEAHVIQGQVLQLLDKTTVNNFFYPPQKTAPVLDWVVASLSHVKESAHVYSPTFKLLYANNRYRTLSGAPPAAMANLYSVFRYLRRTYRNSDEAVKNIMESARTKQPRTFGLKLVKVPGLIIECRAIPVVSQGALLGIVVLADKKVLRNVRRGVPRGRVPAVSTRRRETDNG